MEKSIKTHKLNPQDGDGKRNLVKQMLALFVSYPLVFTCMRVKPTTEAQDKDAVKLKAAKHLALNQHRTLCVSMCVHTFMGG